jgi:hypothetical protein
MSQYYPQPGPFYPPEQMPESDYYDEGEYEYYDDDNGNGAGSSGGLLQIVLAFFAGGCLVFLCMSFCGLVLAGLWILDPGGGSAATPIPGADIGLSFEAPAFPKQSVVNEKNMQLTILDVNRNAAVETIPQVEGREIIIITIELVNLGEEENTFNERDFMLINNFNDAYAPALGAVDGALGRGSLPPGEGLEGRLVFEVIAGEVELILLWEPGQGAQPRYIYLQ